MKLSICLFLVAVSIAGVSHAVDKKPGRADVAPPPGMNDPGVTSTETATPGSDPSTANAVSEDPLAPLPKPDARLARDKASRDASTSTQRIANSEVTRRQQGDDTVEEYRDRGHVWMIKIVQKNGPTQTFTDIDGSGRLNHDPKEGPISPVYFTLYEWK
ncbi:MAG: DUF2782 domain-containing protein [Dokdonella sp.]|uniref:DUF2782 domain-containing protein n=1 Tax=Dokdonella sp. TaxID=2291710 RepID=UPI0032673DE1